MKKLPASLFAAAALCAASSLHASIIVSTSFGGSAAAPTGNTGFSSSIWADAAGGGTASSATFTAGNISSLPTAYTSSGFVNSGNFIQTQGTPAFQTLSSAINVEAANTLYFSFLYRVSVADPGAGGGLSFWNATGGEIFQVGTGGGVANAGTMRIAATAGTVTTAAGSYNSGGDAAWIVGKIVTGVGADTISINVYTGTESVPVTEGAWDATNSISMTANIDSIRFNSPAATRPAQQMDEFRLGTSYASVTTAIPEPSSVAALAGLGALGLVGLRRRRRA